MHLGNNAVANENQNATVTTIRPAAQSPRLILFKIQISHAPRTGEQGRSCGYVI